MSELDAFIAGLPKTELHLHLVGSASPETVLELAKRHPDAGVPTELDELRKFYAFRDFQHFIANIIKVDSMVTKGADIRALLLGLAADAKTNNVRYAEVTVTVGMHLDKGMTADELAETLTATRDEVRRSQGILLNWIFDIPAGMGARIRRDTVEFALHVRPQGTVALGLAGMEDGYPRAGYADDFARARDAGLHVVAHAGETTGPDEVWAAVRTLRAERIGHGIGSAGDARLLKYLADNEIPLEVCPTSNVRTVAVASAAAHPLRALLDAGVPVALSTDDPGMFDCTLNGEYAVAASLGVDRAGLAEIARTGWRAAFCPPELRDAAITEIDTLAST